MGPVAAGIAGAVIPVGAGGIPVGAGRVGGGNPYEGIGMLPSPDTGVIGVPDGGPNPAVALAVQDSLSHYRSLLMPLLSQPTIVPSSGHVPLPCPHTPLLSPDVET